MSNMTNLDEWLSSEGKPTAVYFSDADCVEYVAEDTTALYHRVDGFLTLVYDETSVIPIGFKLKGFKKVLDEMMEELNLDKSKFVELVSVLESVCAKIGNDLFADQKRKQAYDAAAKLAKDVKLYDLPLAA